MRWVGYAALATAIVSGSRSTRAEDAGPGLVLDGGAVWRIFHRLSPPALLQADGSIAPLMMDVKWLDAATAAPPAGWSRPDFDDRVWMRGPVRRSARTPYLEQLCLRGKFMISDPAAVGDLALEIEYFGGAVVRFNDREIARGHWTAGADLAQPYPLEAFLDGDGKLIEGLPSAPVAELRRRTLKATVPREALRRGVNVLAIELRRAPYPVVLFDKKPRGVGGQSKDPGLMWNTCEIRTVSLTCSERRGLEPNFTRPEGLQVWNGSPFLSDVDVDYGDRTESLAPVEIVSPRNGALYGKLLVGRDRPLQGLAVSASDLKMGAVAIPSSAVSFLYAVAGGSEDVYANAEPQDRTVAPYRDGAGFLNMLVPAAPEEYPVARRSSDPARRNGAVAPIWVRVRVPRDAGPGLYEGVLTIRLADTAPVPVPLRVKVLPWTLPDPQQFRTWVELIQSPDTLAVEYNVPLWSPRHFELIAQSFRWIRDTGARSLYIPAIAHTNLGNAESMIRWIRKPDGSYAWDFSVMDRYLDTAQSAWGGPPKLVVLQVWEVYMNTPESTGRRFGEILEQNQKNTGGAPLVTFVNDAGQTENAVIPRLNDPASRAIWKELIAQVRARLKARGIEQTLALGMFTDSTPNKEDTRFFLEVAPGLGWVQQGHNAFQDLHGIAPVTYTATWWSQRFADDLFHSRSGAVGARSPRPRVEEMTSLFGWNRPRLDAYYPRMTNETHPITYWHYLLEATVTGDFYRGIGRVGADYWPAIKNRSGRRVSWVNERFEEVFGYLHSLHSYVLEPREDGPAAMTRLLALESGVQVCEARIFIEDALVNQKLAQRDPALAARCKETLDERLIAMWRTLCHMRFGGWGVSAWRFAPGVAGHAWLLSSNARERDELLFTLAGEVEARLR